MRLDDQSNRIAADAVQLDLILAARLHSMRDAMAGQPGAQHFEVVRSGRQVLHCWVHERDVAQCQRAGLDCDGESMDVHDPTGEAAIGSNPAGADHRQLSKHLKTVEHHLDAALKLLAKYEPQRVVVDRAGIGTCTDCHRYFDGTKGQRLSTYKSTGDPVCPACRARRDRANTEPLKCPSELTRANQTYRCERETAHVGMHRGGGWDWQGTQVERSGAA